MSNIHLMNEELIKNWNSLIKTEDIVYHLGDFALGPKNLQQRLCNSLNGTKILIRGNHDNSARRMLDIGFSEVHRQLILKLDNAPPMTLIHNPAHLPNPTTPIVLHGHIHSKGKFSLRNGVKFLNIGVDVWNLKPITLETILKEIECPI